MEPFGSEERPWTDEEREKIRTFLKYDHHVPFKVAHMVFSAEEEAEYFEKAGNVLAALAVPAFYCFPIIRQQPVVKRALLALVPGYFLHNWGKTTKEELIWAKNMMVLTVVIAFAAYQKFVMYHGQHQHLFI